jgi:hypothetical protein
VNRVSGGLEELAGLRRRQGQEALDGSNDPNPIAQEEEQDEDHDQPAGGGGDRSRREPAQQAARSAGDLADERLQIDPLGEAFDQRRDLGMAAKEVLPEASRLSGLLPHDGVGNLQQQLGCDEGHRQRHQECHEARDQRCRKRWTADPAFGAPMQRPRHDSEDGRPQDRSEQRKSDERAQRDAQQGDGREADRRGLSIGSRPRASCRCRIRCPPWPRPISAAHQAGRSARKTPGKCATRASPTRSPRVRSRSFR